MSILASLGIVRQERPLPNGMRLVLYRKPASPIYVSLAYDAGARRDHADLQGVAHFLERLVVAGSEKYPTKRELAHFVERFGGAAGGSTNLVRLQRWISVADEEGLRRVFPVFAEAMQRLKIIPAAVEKERSVILQELRQSDSDPVRKSYAVAGRSYRGTPYDRDVLGTVDSLRRIAVSDLEEAYEKMISRPGAVLVVVGDIGMDRLVEIICASLSVQSREAAAVESLAVQVSEGGCSVHSIPGAESSSVALTYHLPPQSGNRFEPLRRFLGRGRGSLLSQILRADRGLVYTVGAHLAGAPEAPSLRIVTACAPESIRAVHKGIDEALQRVAAKVPEDEAEWLRVSALNGRPFDWEQSHALAAWVLTSELYGVPDGGLVAEEEAYMAVDSRSLAAAAIAMAQINPHVAVAGAVPDDMMEATTAL